MKILLRDYGTERYIWKTAKYNNGNFYVDGEQQHQCNIVSIVNDNRKNYIQCSCCGETFRRGDNRFQIHKENAIKPETCFGCSNLSVDNAVTTKKKYVMNKDGRFSEKLERSVVLKCSKGLWSYYNIDSDKAINSCRKRLCANATEIEIDDFFTRYPGAFDDIITIDRLLDEGYNANVGNTYNVSCFLVNNDKYTISVEVNKLGIVDHFTVYLSGDDFVVYYSKKYNELFSNYRNYEIWNYNGLDDEIREEIKAHIAKLYY